MFRIFSFLIRRVGLSETEDNYLHVHITKHIKCSALKVIEFLDLALSLSLSLSLFLSLSLSLYLSLSLLSLSLFLYLSLSLFIYLSLSFSLSLLSLSLSLSLSLYLSLSFFISLKYFTCLSMVFSPHFSSPYIYFCTYLYLFLEQLPFSYSCFFLTTGSDLINVAFPMVFIYLLTIVSVFAKETSARQS